MRIGQMAISNCVLTSV